MITKQTSSHVNPISTQHYGELPGELYSQTNPVPNGASTLSEINQGLLNELGTDSQWFESEEGLATLSGNATDTNNPPIALAYAGHQFGHWVPLLGDGRAHMLGQVKSKDGKFFDVHLKGSGRTPYSRGGDGRATLGAVLREYIISEAMAGLGISTTRSLAVIATGEDVYRETSLPGAILVRLAESHVRVGTFQYAATALGEPAVKAVADFVITHHFPELEYEDESDKYRALLRAVAEKQAKLIAQWLLVGFIHGVMNTDNMSIVGETIDYGPCAFMDEFKADKVFSSIDRPGRYAWHKQPSIGYWNLSRFADTLLPLLHETQADAIAIAEASLGAYTSTFDETFHRGLLNKLGIASSDDETMSFANSTLALMEEHEIDFTVIFDQLTRVAQGDDEKLVSRLFAKTNSATEWLAQWQKYRTDDPTDNATMRSANPALIARNHRVEEAIEAAHSQNDLEPFRRLCAALQNPYEVAKEHRELMLPPTPDQLVTKTFCGT